MKRMLMLGTILMQQGRFDEAAASFDLANALDTQDVVGPVSLVHVKPALGDGSAVDRTVGAEFAKSGHNRERGACLSISH